MIIKLKDTVLDRMLLIICTKKSYSVTFYIEKLTKYMNALQHFVILPLMLFLQKEGKIDGVGPVDKRPSTDQLNHFVTFFFIFFL